MARKHGERWFLAALNDWQERGFEINLAFLEAGNWHVEIFRDGLNANKHAEDYSLTTTSLTKTDNLTIRLAKGGGFVAIFKPDIE